MTSIFRNRGNRENDNDFGIYFKYQDNGTVSIRRIVPSSIKIIFDPYVKGEEKQWLIHAVDIDKKSVETFKMSNIIKIYGSYNELINSADND
jgi:hypothetical protein